MGGDASHYYQVLYDFTAEEKVELSVERGERLRLIDSTIQDGWVRAEVFSEPDRQGFVPVSYLKLESPQNFTEEDSDTTELKFSSMETHLLKGNALDVSSIPKRRDLGNHSQLSSPAQDRSRISGISKFESLDARPSDESVGVHIRQRGGDPITTGIVGHVDFSRKVMGVHNINEKELDNEQHIRKVFMDGFRRDKTYFSQLMRRRTDALVDLRTRLEDTVENVRVCKEMNVLLSKRLCEMDQITEKEHLQRVECVEEVKLCARRLLLSPFGRTPEKKDVNTDNMLREHS
ncbi:unnamed protein product [Phytomonas sp. Hart1]|nr:unnamed protein product [Phytomonas sp. Hart1]|eukprot:CCW68125.1 unnamed protein product [Phytomonas sp. isolate Hart1]